MEQKTITYQDKKISYTIYGEGAPVMLVHGFAEDESVWKNQVTFLKNDYRLIVPQLPGTGKSEQLPETSMETLAESLHQIILQENIDSFILIGHSMGGYTTLAFAEKYPELLKAFGLFHSNANADSEEKAEDRKKSNNFINAHGTVEFIKTTAPNLFSDHTKKENPELIENFIEGIAPFEKEALTAYQDAMIKRPDRTAVLSNAKVPVLFILGEHDMIPLETALKQSSMPETSHIHILRDSAHMGMLEETEKSNNIIKEFLENVIRK